MMMYSRFLIILLVLLLSHNVHAWGPLGHQAVCDIAWRKSTQDLRKLLAQIAKRQGYNTFAESCVWADHVRRQDGYKWLAPLHYVNVPRAAKTTSGAACLKGSKNKPECVLTAIPYFLHLYGSTDSRKIKDEAILLVGHFVGDLHQPLHIAYADDRGGTQKKIIFEGKILSLHQLWDTQIITCGYRGGWRQLGKSLSKRETYKKETYSNLRSEVVDWADESLALTRQVYQHLTQRLPDTYCAQYHSIAIDRLAVAGERLASLLASMLAP